MPGDALLRWIYVSENNKVVSNKSLIKIKWNQTVLLKNKNIVE